VDVFEVGLSECKITAPNGLTITGDSLGIDITGTCLFRSTADPTYHSVWQQFSTGLLRLQPQHTSGSVAMYVSDTGGSLYDALRLSYIYGVECGLNLSLLSGSEIFFIMH
jgi:hypothetical protein